MADTDKVYWNEIARKILDGVMHHVVLLEECEQHELCGFANMHKHHAEEEFNSYLHTVQDYIKLYKENPDTTGIIAPIIAIKGSTKEEKMENALNIYEDWEKEVLKFLKETQEKIIDYKDEVNYLIDDVKKELYCIRRMQDDLADDKAEELNDWLYKKFGE